MSAVLDEYHHLVTALENEKHALAGRFRAIYDHLRGEATTDAEQVAHDAGAAAKPVVAEVEADAAKLGGEAAADTAKAVTDPAPPAA